MHNNYWYCNRLVYPVVGLRELLLGFLKQRANALQCRCFLVVFLCDSNRWQTSARSNCGHIRILSSFIRPFDITLEILISSNMQHKKIIKYAIIIFLWCVVVQYSSVILVCLLQGCTNFTKILGWPLNSRCQKGDMKQVPCWGSTNIRHQHINSSQHSDMDPGFVHPYFTILFTHFQHLQNNNWLLSEVTLKSQI